MNYDLRVGYGRSIIAEIARRMVLDLESAIP